MEDTKEEFVDYKKMYDVKLAEVEKEVILKCIEACGGNKSEAAKRLEMNRKTLYNRMEKLKIAH